MYTQASRGHGHLLGALLTAVMITITLSGCLCFPGMKLLTMEIYQNDQLILRTNFDAHDSKGPIYFWQRAGEAPFSSDQNIVGVKPSESNPLRATITGSVRIQILHVESIMTSASLTDLDLVRETRENNLWYLPENEVERTRKAAGL